MSELTGADEARGRWEAERRRDALRLIWEWDPLGIQGVAESYYEPLAAAAVKVLASEGGSDALRETLTAEVMRLADEGFSRGAAERSTERSALAPVVERLSAWWATVPPAPSTAPG